jgi:hypothetical protein
MVSLISGPSPKDLTRRANHLHIFKIEEFQPAPGKTGRGLFASGGGRISDFLRRLFIATVHDLF